MTEVPPDPPGPTRPEPARPDRGHTDRSRPDRTTLVAAGGAAVLLGVTVWTLVDLSRDHSTPEPAAAPVTTSPTGPTPTPAEPIPVTARSSEPPGPVERCGEYHLRRAFGDGVGIRECSPDWALLFVPTGRTGLYRWSGERWEFFADPYSGRCREELTGIGVPELQTRDFPPCERPSPTTESSSPTPEPSSPAPGPSGAPSGDLEVRGPIGVDAPNGGSDPRLPGGN